MTAKDQEIAASQGLLLSQVVTVTVFVWLMQAYVYET